jgi:hypothetical protein
VRDVLERALRESLAAGHGFEGTGHLLLGFTRTEEGLELLGELGVKPDVLRHHILAAIADHPEERSLRPEPPTMRRFSEQMAAAANLYSFTRQVQGANTEAALLIGQELWEAFRRATRLALEAGKEPVDILRAQSEAAEVIEAALTDAQHALSNIGIHQ